MIPIPQLQFKLRQTLLALPVLPRGYQVAPAITAVQLVKVKRGEIQTTCIAQLTEEPMDTSLVVDQHGPGLKLSPTSIAVVLYQCIVDDVDLGNGDQGNRLLE